LLVRIVGLVFKLRIIVIGIIRVIRLLSIRIRRLRRVSVVSVIVVSSLCLVSLLFTITMDQSC
jgi:hypothetical protein